MSWFRRMLNRHGIAALPDHRQKPVEIDPKVQVIAPSLVESLRMEIGHVGTQVYLQIGNHKLDLDYPSAIKVSSLLRVHAKQAKKFAGDGTKHWTSESVLTDAELNYKRGF